VNSYLTRFVLGWLAGVGAACTSAPIRYYTLIPPPDQSVAVGEPTLAIDVRVVHIPPELDRSELMVRTGPTETALLENERWASPIHEEIKEAVQLELQRLLEPRSGSSPTLAKLAVDIDVQRLEAELGRYARLVASWSANLSGSGPIPDRARAPTCTFRAAAEIHGGYAAMVTGYQREIAAFAAAIAAGVRRAASGIDAACPAPIGLEDRQE